MAIRDMDVAAGGDRHPPDVRQAEAFAVSSFIVGVAGALWAFMHLGAWEPAAFSIDRSFQLLFMVIIGGLGSIAGASSAPPSSCCCRSRSPVPALLGSLPLSVATAVHLVHIIFGSLIVFFLIVEPHGLARSCGASPSRSCGCGPSRTDAAPPGC
jgi:branched-chain amino acid transport system permease protein